MLAHPTATRTTTRAKRIVKQPGPEEVFLAGVTAVLAGAAFLVDITRIFLPKKKPRPLVRVYGPENAQGTHTAQTRVTLFALNSNGCKNNSAY